jgi:predicted TIM-barrel fold metal-dependent hydrolase
MAATGSKPGPFPGHRAQRYANRAPTNEVLYSWLRQEHAEPILEPELAIIDPHHHLWDLRGQEYIYGPRGQVVYGLEECLEDLCDGHRVVATVFVQVSAGGTYPNWKPAISLPATLRPLAEVELCQGVAAQQAAAFPAAPQICAGIIGYVDFRQAPGGPEALLQECTKLRNYRGVRTGPPDASDLQFCAGLACLQRLGLVYEGLGELGALKAVALKFPGLTVVLNHLGAPPPLGSDQAAVSKWEGE